jgi:hypothetical protein
MAWKKNDDIKVAFDKTLLSTVTTRVIRFLYGRHPRRPESPCKISAKKPSHPEFRILVAILYHKFISCTHRNTAHTRPCMHFQLPLPMTANRETSARTNGATVRVLSPAEPHRLGRKLRWEKCMDFDCSTDGLFVFMIIAPMPAWMMHQLIGQNPLISFDRDRYCLCCDACR